MHALSDTVGATADQAGDHSGDQAGAGIPSQTGSNGSAQNCAWSRCVAQPAREFGPSKLTVLSGKLPPGLRGTLYRNGPARFERGGIRAGHWFDGDGAVLAVQFDGADGTATYRYVQSAGYRDEQAADRLLYGNYGMTAPGPIWNQWRRPLKNAANTSVLALPDRLLALWEGGGPHALDLETLSTRGLDNLAGPGGRLGHRDPVSAHPKQDPDSGEIYNFGIGINSRNATLNLYRCDRQGRLLAKRRHRLEGVPLIHDFVMAGHWLVFLVPPIRIDVLPILLGRSSYYDAMRWLPELGTSILIFDRRTLEQVARSESDPWFQWHFGNGAMSSNGRALVLDLVRYEDFSTNQHLREVPTGRTVTPAYGRLWRMILDSANAHVDEFACMSERSVEFPTVSPKCIGQPWSGTYMAIHRVGTDTTAERYDGLARFDHTAAGLPGLELVEADLGDGRYPSEPIIAADADGEHHWLISVVYDGNADTGEVWIYDAAALAAGPVCVLGLPDVVPLSFHGCWRERRP